jgi:hypothetical protein
MNDSTRRALGEPIGYQDLPTVMSSIRNTTTTTGGGVTQTAARVDPASAGKARAKSGRPQYKSPLTGVTYAMPTTSEGWHRLKQVDQRLRFHLDRAKKNLPPPTENEELVAQVNRYLAPYARLQQAQRNDLEEKRKRLEAYRREALEDARPKLSTIFHSPLDMFWSAVRLNHALYSSGDEQMPTLREAGQSLSGLGKEIEENFTDGAVTNYVADLERKYSPALLRPYLGEKGFTGHVAGFLGGIPASMTAFAGGLATSGSQHTNLSEKAGGVGDVILNSPILGELGGPVVKKLYARFGSQQVDRAAQWLKSKGIPTTEQAIQRVIEWASRDVEASADWAARKWRTVQDGLNTLGSQIGRSFHPSLAPEIDPGEGLVRRYRELADRMASGATAPQRAPQRALAPISRTAIRSNAAQRVQPLYAVDPRASGGKRELYGGVRSSGPTIIIKSGETRYPAAIPGSDRRLVTKELLDWLLPKKKRIPMPALFLDKAVNDDIRTSFGSSVVRAQGGPYGEVYYPDGFEPRDGNIATSVNGPHTASELFRKIQQSGGHAVTFALTDPAVTSSHMALLGGAELRDAILHGGMDEDDVLELIHYAAVRTANLKKYAKSGYRFPELDSLGEWNHWISSIGSFERLRDILPRIFSEHQSYVPRASELISKLLEKDVAPYEHGHAMGFLTFDQGASPLARALTPEAYQHHRYDISFLGRNEGILNGTQDLIQIYPDLAEQAFAAFKKRMGRPPSRREWHSLMRLKLQYNQEVHYADRNALIRSGH